LKGEDYEPGSCSWLGGSYALCQRNVAASGRASSKSVTGIDLQMCRWVYRHLEPNESVFLQEYIGS
jgi:hypothetical protein